MLLIILVFQAVKVQMAQKGSHIQEDGTYHHLQSGLREDKFRGLLIASVLSAGILPTLLLIIPEEGGQDPDHLFGGKDECQGEKMIGITSTGSKQEKHKFEVFRAKFVMFAICKDS